MQPTEMKKLMDIVAGRTAHSAMLESIKGDEYKQMYITWYNLGPSLTEAAVTKDQVEAIFKAVADGARAGKNVEKGEADPSSNRTFLGKTADVGSKIADAWNGFKEKIAMSGPVSGFDVAFDDVQKKLLNAAGGDSGAIGKALNTYKQFATKHPVMQGAIYSGLIILAGISGWGLGGAAILAGIRTLDRLLQGDRASSALWKGFKTGALSYGASHLMGHGGPDAGGGDTPDTGGDTPNTDNIPVTDGDISKYTIVKGDQLGYIAQANGVSVEDIRGLNPQIDFSKPLQPGMEINLPAQGDGAGSVWQNYRGDMYGDHASQASPDASQATPNNPDYTQRVPPKYPDAPLDNPATGGSQLTPRDNNWQNYADAGQTTGQNAGQTAGQAAGQTAGQAPYGTNMSDEYLQRVIDAQKNGARVRFLISPEDAQKALDWKAQNANRALGESFNSDRIIRTWMLQESMKLPLQSKLYLTQAGVERIFEAVSRKELVNEGVWDSIKNAAGSAVDSVKKGWDTATNKITYEKLMLWWNKNYSARTFDPNTGKSEVDTQEVYDFLKRMGVTENLIKQVFNELKIPLGASASPDSIQATTGGDVSAQGAQDAQSATSGTPATATKTSPIQIAQELKTLWDKWREEGASTGAPAVRAQLKDMWMSSGGTGTMAEGRKIRR